MNNIYSLYFFFKWGCYWRIHK